MQQEKHSPLRANLNPQMIHFVLIRHQGKPLNSNHTSFLQNIETQVRPKEGSNFKRLFSAFSFSTGPYKFYMM